ncbi:UNVERIFIED_CONTAM: hypothetical protein FKN15_031994 [Acipenser sinensis]
MKVMQFQGNSHENSQPAAPISLPPIEDPDLVPSPDVPLAILKRKLMATNDISTAKRYLEEINSHLKVRAKLLPPCYCTMHNQPPTLMHWVSEPLVHSYSHGNNMLHRGVGGG